ncbi:hypothetical protein HMPREF9318_00630 [Streptococcus urinalis FB127-CNA-2]|uniref:ABC transporter domain-containing protein n=1 Tax=Streptococcus urinalis 2285-97 TaxID=764291 RepID=G5KGZ2_9STRE|nr:hypothetical protein STRUR_1386 [Streptococcus urinalis 2285-97]EKS22432.1 hypothetical protein HMPREF9318_00630 [Streptococcus urinalis FB127-CNA-2]VEF32245.1 ABC transporter ATP-binding protein [Streptococcus urinalis]
MISVEKLTKVVNNQKILNDINFSVKPGDCLAIIGPNGAGKTSLMLSL